jgi:SAM-dependent methyltransferase
MGKYLKNMLIKKWKSKMKKLILLTLKFINIFTKLIPSALFLTFSKIIILFRTYSNNPKKDLILLLNIKDEIEKIINNRALAYGEGEHPKHKLTEYHQFFINNIFDGESVIDIGCGYGSVSRSIAKAKSNSKILGIDNDKTRLQQALESENPSNLQFIYGDAIQYPFKENWDVVVLSNVLEHIESRVEFLLSLLNSNIKAKRFLIRVPCYERDWQVPLRDHFGVNYFTDSDHKIEHKLLEFCNEINQAKLEISKIITNWGEIWAVCIPVNK